MSPMKLISHLLKPRQIKQTHSSSLISKKHSSLTQLNLLSISVKLHYLYLIEQRVVYTMQISSYLEITLKGKCMSGYYFLKPILLSWMRKINFQKLKKWLRNFKNHSHIFKKFLILYPNQKTKKNIHSLYIILLYAPIKLSDSSLSQIGKNILVILQKKQKNLLRILMTLTIIGDADLHIHCFGVCMMQIKRLMHSKFLIDSGITQERKEIVIFKIVYLG